MGRAEQIQLDASWWSPRGKRLNARSVRAHVAATAVASRRQSLEGGADGFWRVAVLEARARLACIASVPGTGRTVRERGFSGAAAFHVRLVVRSAARTLLQPLRLLFRTPRGGSGNRDCVSPSPSPSPCPPLPERARSAPHPHLSACPLRRHVGAGPDARNAGPVDGHLPGR